MAGTTDLVVEQLNRDSVERSAWLARALAGVVLAAGIVAAAAWLWLVYRQQSRIDDIGFTPFGEDTSDGLSAAERLDLLAATTSLLAIAGVAVAAGLVLRLLADYTQARVGGDVTGYRRSVAEDEYDELDDDDDAGEA